MDHIGALSEGEWTSLSGMYTAEEADFMAQLLESCPPSSMAVPDAFWTGNEDQSAMNMSAGNYEGSHYSSETTNSDLYRISSQGSDCSVGGNMIFCPTSSNESYYLSDSHPMLVTNNSNGSMSFNSRTGDAKNINSYLIKGDDHQCLNQETSGGNVEDSGGNQPEAVTLEKKRFEMTVQGPASMKEKSMPPKNSMKRGHSFGDFQINKRNTRSKKSLQVTTSNNEEHGNVGPNRQSSSSCCSVDDSIASQELSGGVTSTSSLSPKEAAALNSDGKSRARRGSATDPQSLYARKRREKINDRLRVLQNLVPNGTKVDISTMLEEAVHYVKFLELQIKLLSSDDMWMYAPICYNGMDLGLDLKLFTPPKPS